MGSAKFHLSLLLAGISLLMLCCTTVKANSEPVLWKSIDAVPGEYGSYTVRVGRDPANDPFLLFVQSHYDPSPYLITTRWVSSGMREPHWLELNFGTARTFDEVDLHFFDQASISYYLEDYKLQYWASGNWVDIVSVSDNTLKHRQHLFSPVTSEKIRLYITDAGPDNFARVSEMRVFDTAGNNIALAASGTKARSDSFKDQYSLANKAIDGYIDPNLKKWLSASGVTGPHWIQLDFGQTVSFDEIRLVEANFQQFKIQYNSGTVGTPVWTDISDVTGHTGSFYHTGFSTLSARQVRVLVTHPAGQASLSSFKVYNRSTDINLAKTATATASTSELGADASFVTTTDDIQEISAITAVDPDGTILFQWGTPERDNAIAGYDLPVQIYDIDQDGSDEIVIVADDKLKILSSTGAVEKEAVLPINGDAIVICNVSGNAGAQDILVKDRYRNAIVYDHNLNVLWTYENASYNLSHFAEAYDVDGDGKDEIFIGDELRDDDGEVLWVYDMGADHTDSIKVADFDLSNPGPEIMVAHSDDGTYLLDADGEPLAEDTTVGHAQKVVAGDFYPEIDGMEIFQTTRTPAHDINLATGEGVSIAADSVYSTFGAGEAIDGNVDSMNSRWVSGDASSIHWLRIDFGAVKYFYKARLYFYLDANYEYFLEDYKLQYNAGTVEHPVWVDFVTVSGNTEQSRVEHVFDVVAAREVRLYITNPSTNGDQRARLYEIEIIQHKSPEIMPYAGDGSRLWSEDWVITDQLAVLQTDTSKWSIAGSGQEYLFAPKMRKVLDGHKNVIAELPPSSINRLGKSVDLGGDAREELLVYDETGVEIYTNTAAIPDGGRNLARGTGVSVSADSQYSGDFAPGKLVDGDRTSYASRWLSADAPGDHWVVIDFGTHMPFDEIWLYFFESSGGYKYFLKDYKLQYNAGTAGSPVWTDLVSVKDNGKAVYAVTFDPVYARQVRLWVTAPNILNTDHIARLHEIEIYEAPYKANLSSSASTTVTADSEYSVDFQADKAIDGNTYSHFSRWLSEDTPGDHWLTVDFGEARTFDEIRLYFFESSIAEYFLEDYKIQYNSGTIGSPVWTDLASVTGSSTKNPVHIVPKTTAQQLRLYVTDPNTNNNDNIARLYEIEIFESPESLSASATATGDSQFSGTHSYDKAIDGDRNTYWRSDDQSGSHWLKIDLGSSQTFDQVWMYMEEVTDGPLRDFRIQYNSGAVGTPVWEDIVAVLANEEKAVKYAFHPVTAREVRVWIEQGGLGAGRAAIHEIDILEAESYSAQPVTNVNLENATKGSHMWTNY